MSFAAVSETFSSISSTAATYLNPVKDFAVQWGGYAVSAVHEGISTHVVGQISNIFASTASSGPIAGPAIVISATLVSAFVAHKLWNASSRIAQIVGFTLGIGAGVATVGTAGIIFGGVGVAAYVAGGTVSAATLLL